MSIYTDTISNQAPQLQDCYFGIFLHLNKFQLAKISTVCREWNALINDEPQTLWRHLAAQHFQTEKFYFPSLIHSEKFDPLKLFTCREETLEQEVRKVHAMVSKCGLFPEFLIVVGNTMIRSYHEHKDVRIEESFPFCRVFDFLRAGWTYLSQGFKHKDLSIRLASIEAFKNLATYFERHCEFPFDWNHRFFVRFTQSYVLGTKNNPEEKLAVRLMELFNKNLVMIQGFYPHFCASAKEKNEIFEEIAKLQPTNFNWKQMLLSGEHRKYNTINLCLIHDSLLVISQKSFEESRLRILKLSCKALIGLCQRDRESVLKFITPEGRTPPKSRYFGELEDAFEQIEAYFHIPDVLSDYDDHQGSTSLLRKGAVLYILQGLNSKNEEVRNEALKVIFKFSKDYFSFSSKIPTHTHAKEILFELAMGYWMITSNLGYSDTLRCVNLCKILKNNIELLKEFSSKLADTEEDKIRLDVLINKIPSSEEKNS